MNEKDEIRLAQVGERLKSLRDEVDYALRDLQFKTGIDNSKLAKVEKGKVGISLTTFFDLLAGIGIHPRDFFNYEVDWQTTPGAKLGQRSREDVSKEIITKLMEKIPRPAEIPIFPGSGDG